MRDIPARIKRMAVFGVLEWPPCHREWTYVETRSLPLPVLTLCCERHLRMRQSKDQVQRTKNQDPRPKNLLCSCSSRFFCAVGHVVTLSRVNIQLARLALSIFGLHPYLEAVQPPVV